MSEESLIEHWQLLVGTTLGPGKWFSIDQPRIDAFADVTLDHQMIHVDPEADATKELGGTIAHGFLGLSMLSHLSQELLEPHSRGHVVLNYGLNRVRFITPVPAASKIRLTATVLTAETKPTGLMIAYDAIVEIEQQHKPAFVAEQLLLILN